jgi:phage tail-like protein
MTLDEKLMTSYYPPPAFYFRIEFGIDGIQKNDSRFQEVSGIGSEVDVEEINEGGENRFVHGLPKAVKHSNLVFKRGFISDSKIIAWLNDTLGGGLSNPVKPVEITVKLLNELNEQVVSWKVENAFPVKFEVDNFNSNSNELIIESIEFAYTNITREHK